MMPLTMAEMGQEMSIKKINGRDKTKKFLESLGFVVGEKVSVISNLGGTVILNVKDTRIALDEDMARRIMI